MMRILNITMQVANKSINQIICLFVLMILTGLVNAQVVGKVSLLKGVVSASDGSTLRALAKGSDILLKDQIETSADSFVVVKMSDGGKLTLRPNTILQVVEYNQSPGEEVERMKLIKGGLRALTGAIGKIRPEAVTLETRTTTIGIRGTDFLVRDCVDCQEDENKLADSQRVKPSQAGQTGNGLPEVYVMKGEKRYKVIREDVLRIVDAVYFAVFEGAIYAESSDERIDLNAVDACFRQGAFKCLPEIPRFMLYDQFLVNPNDEFTLFNIFKNLDDEEALCEINWK